jgi:isopenicillin-N N-acyltransferase-like protein
MNRRDFLAAGSGALLWLKLGGCTRNLRKPAPLEKFPVLEVSGSPYDIGLAIGKRFGSFVQKGLQRRKKWFEKIRNYMEADLDNRYQPFLEAGTRAFPEVVKELKGWADGSGVPFKDLMALNLKSELGALMEEEGADQPGCSTLGLAHRNRILLAHNEDGHKAYGDLMFLVKASPKGKPSFTCMTYPGILCGNGPAMNDSGLAVSTNFIGGLKTMKGIPRYFISRAVLGAQTLDEAVKIVTLPGRAFYFHFNLGSSSEKKLLSVETSPERHQLKEVQGLYIHTNHLILDEMKDIPEDQKYMDLSSIPRYRTLQALTKDIRKDPNQVDGKRLIQWLSNHQGAPYSPCRHPKDEAEGATLGTALFDLAAGTFRLYHGNPCNGNSYLV